MRSILAALFLFLTAGRAFAIGEIANAARQLAADVDARIVAIGSPVPKPLANEAKNLKLAAAKFAKYSGGERVPDLKVLAVAGKFVALSRTADAAIVNDISALVQEFADGVTYRKDRFTDFRDLLVDPAHVRALKAIEAVAAKALETGLSVLAENPVRAASGLIKAYDLFGLISDRAKKFLALEDGSPPPDGLSYDSTGSSLGLVNSGPGVYDIQKIRVFATVLDGATEVKKYTGQTAKSQIPGLFSVRGSNRIAAATTFDLLPVMAQLVPDGVTNANVFGELHVYLKGADFFVVSFNVVVP